MTEEVSLLPLALTEVEREIAVVDSEADRLTAGVMKLAVKKRSLLKTLRGLEELLGRVEPEPLSPMNASLNEIEMPSGAYSVSRNAFRYMGPAAAGRKLLRNTGHRLTHAELVDALLRGSVKSKAKYPSDSFRTAMQRRTDWFVWKKEVGHFGCWELVEWQKDEEKPKLTDAAGISRTLSLVRPGLPSKNAEFPG